jgi:hypothetical protein
VEHRQEKYRALFDSDLGIEVLNDIAVNCGYYADLKTTEQMVLSNFFKWLLEMIGIYDEEHVEKAALMRKLMELPLIPEEKKDAEGI